MIVRLDLQHNMDIFFVVCVGRVSRLRKEPPAAPAANHRRIVAISREHILARHFVRIANHLKERARLLHLVDSPAGIEDLVAAVFAVGLREHV